MLIRLAHIEITFLCTVLTIKQDHHENMDRSSTNIWRISQITFTEKANSVAMETHAFCPILIAWLGAGLNSGLSQTFGESVLFYHKSSVKYKKYKINQR